MTMTYVARAGGGRRLEGIAGTVHRITLDAAATGGPLTVIRSTMRAGAASPVHVHGHEDETVFVLSGSGIVWAGDRRWALSSGDTAFLPRGVPHTYLITSEEVELLTVCNPVGMGGLFRAAGWDLVFQQPEDRIVDLKALAEAGMAAGQIVLGPPLGSDDLMPAEYLNR
jgi:quercetin dioxygenase-like cupin family protein